MSEHLATQLSAYLHGELSPPAAAELEAHLAACSDCRTELASLRRTHEMLDRLAQSEPSAAVWARIQTELHAAPMPSLRTGRGKAVWLGASALATAAALILLLWPWGNEPRVALDPYLSLVEAAPTDPAVLAASASSFRPLSTGDALAAAGMSGALRDSPSPEYSVWRGSCYSFKSGEVAQLVYRQGERCFSVFVAPHAATFDFGARQTERVRMGNWECTKVESERLAIYWAVSADRQSLLVAPAEEELNVAAILSFFVYGLWDRES